MAAHFAAMSTALAQGRRLRHRRRAHLRLLGLGRRPLFGVVGDRPVADDRHRAGRTSARSSPAAGRWTSISARRRSPSNMPVILGLIGIWYRNVMGFPVYAVLPYDQRLKRLPAYLQQLDMESNGKRVHLDGATVVRRHRPDRLRRAGHQRPARLLPADPPGHRRDPGAISWSAPIPTRPTTAPPGAAARQLPGAERGADARQDARRGEGRAEGAGHGRPTAIERLAPHKVFPGNRPSNTILYRRLDPHTLGMIIALYEHKVFVQGDDLGDQLLRPVGRRARQDAGHGAPADGRGQGPAR